jgi:hypothetical protein
MSAGSIKAPNSAALRIRSLLCVLRLRLGGQACFPIASLILLVRLCLVPFAFNVGPRRRTRPIRSLPPRRHRHRVPGRKIPGADNRADSRGNVRALPCVTYESRDPRSVRGEIDATTGMAASPRDPCCGHGLRALWSRRQPGNALSSRGEPGTRDHVLPGRFRPGRHRERGCSPQPEPWLVVGPALGPLGFPAGAVFRSGRTSPGRLHVYCPGSRADARRCDQHIRLPAGDRPWLFQAGAGTYP